MYKTEDFDDIESIAIIGMSCRFPDANNINEFWDNLKNGKESISFFKEDELLNAGVDKDLVNDPFYIKTACIINDIDMFDPSFFGYTDTEAELIDPQQRIFLECAYGAFEDAGYSPQSYDGAIGVFGGMRTSGYAKVLDVLFERPGTSRTFEATLGTAVDQICFRVSDTLDLKGPSVGIQTGCSTSIVATHMACESLRSGECDMALAGASALYIPQKQGYLYDDKMITSPEGSCKVFDANAQGTIPGNGVGIVLLKRLSDAIEDRDHIYAVIRGSAVNNDGSSKRRYQAPSSIEGQKLVIEEALLISNVNPESLTYVEANGIGTLLGDSMEIEALTRAFQTQTDKGNFCGIGSVKANIGHLSNAAGIASLIKAALSLKNKQLPPSPNCNTPNPQLQGTPFYVLQKCLEWKTNSLPRRVGINSFAIGGTNSHMILEEAPSVPQIEGKKRNGFFYIFTISAKSENALKDLVSRYVTFFKKNQHCSIEDICFTSNIGRSHYPFRLAVVADSKENLYEQLSASSSEIKQVSGLARFKKERVAPKIAFLFSDVISREFVPVSRFFYDRIPQFRKAIDRCAAILRKYHGKLLIDDLYRNYSEDANTYAQTTIFAIEYALYQMWNSWGITPSVIMGHGIGEYVAACVAGIFSVDDALKLCFSIENNSSFLVLSNIIDKMTLASPTVEMISPDTGCLMGKTENNMKNYWVRKYTKSVELNVEWNFFKEQSINSFIIIGPDNLFFNEWQKNNMQKNSMALQSFSKNQNEWQKILGYLGNIYVRGMDIDWNEFVKGCTYKRISLPTYPFQKKRCWFDCKK